jgi:hypothetical protein
MSEGAVEVEARPCELCELERVLRGQSGEFRRALQKMSPVKNPEYDRLFGGLVYADRSLAMLKGRARGQHRSHGDRADA